MSKFFYYLPSLIFNLAETLVIFLVGLLLKLDFKIIILILVLFAMIRMKLGKSMYYKDWYKCLIWSTLVFLSLFVVAKVDIIICIIMTIFCAFILTNKADINDIFEWKGKSTKYADIDEFIKYHSFDDKLIEFEKKIKEQDNLDYLIYKYRFKDNLTFEEMGDRLDIQTNRITERLDRISFALRLYCGI